MTHFQSLLNVLHASVNPFDRFQYTRSDLDNQGWNSTHPMFEKIIAELRPKTIVEVGTWKGGSARHMAAITKKYNLHAAIVCVDTWLGEEILWCDPTWKGSLRMEHGRPQVYRTFMANTIQANHHDTLIPISMPSPAGARYLRAKEVAADFVYIDASHIEGDVINDLNVYWDNVLREGGIMLIDDYAHDSKGQFDGLMRDVDKFCEQRRLGRIVEHEKILLRKGPQGSQHALDSTPRLQPGTRLESPLETPASKLRIAVISCWWNEEKLAKLFLKSHAYADSIFILSDTAATDHSRDIAAANPRVIVLPIAMPNGFDDGVKIDAINSLAQSFVGRFDWVVAVDSDEFMVSNIRSILATPGEADHFYLKMWNLYKHVSEAPLNPDGELNQRRHGTHPQRIDMKPCVARPSVNLKWDVGCHKTISGVKNLSDTRIWGTHWHWADPELAVERILVRKKRLSDNNKAKGWGAHCFQATEENIRAHCAKNADAPLIPEIR